MPDKEKSNAKKTASKAAEKPIVKKSTPAATKVKKPAVKEATAAPAKKRSTATPKKKEKIIVEPTTANEVTLPRHVVEVAAYLNWCGRRNQGLPDDAFSDWITAETVTGLAN
jgi:hypothetical protein